MTRKEQFENLVRITPELKDQDLKNISVIADFIGRNINFLKEIYQSLATGEPVTHQPDIGAPVSVTLNIETGFINMMRGKMSLEFTIEAFLSFIHLIDICFIDTLPLGSVVTLDPYFLPMETQKRLEETDKGFNVMIVSQKQTIDKGVPNIYADYYVTLWPYGLAEYSPPFIIPTLAIKEVLHKGYQTGGQKKYLEVVNSKIISNNMKSFMYLTARQQQDIQTGKAGESSG